MAWQEQQPTCRVERHGPSTRGKAHTQAQSEEGMGCKERKPKVPCIIHATRVKRIPERVTESNKPGGNDKRVKAKKVLGSNGSGACTQGSGETSQLVKKKKELKIRFFLVPTCPT